MKNIVMYMHLVFFSLVTVEGSLPINETFPATNVSTISEVLSEEQYNYSLTTSADEVESDEWEIQCYAMKHESFCNCSSDYIVLEPTDYNNESGVLHIVKLNVVLNSSFYEIYNHGQIIACISHLYRAVETDKNWKPLTYISVIGIALSMIAMMTHLVAFLLFRDFRNMPGCNLACLCLSMLCGYASFLIGNLKTIQGTFEACVASAVTTQFFLLSSLMWMNVISCDVFRSVLSSTSKLRLLSSTFKPKKFLFSGLYSWGTSLAIVSLAVTTDNVDEIPLEHRPRFGRGKCWFNQLKAIWVFFVAPVFVAIGINVILFGSSAYVIFSNRMKTDDSKRRRHIESLVLYSKLALITGMLWVFAVLARVTDNIVLWYFFAVSNSLQGFFIFLAFTLTPKARNYLSQKVFSCITKRSSSIYISTATSVTSAGEWSENKV